MTPRVRTTNRRSTPDLLITQALERTPSFIPSLFSGSYVLAALASSPNARANLVMATLVAGTIALGPLLVYGKPLSLQSGSVLFAVIPACAGLVAVWIGRRASFAAGPFIFCTLYWTAALHTASQLRSAYPPAAPRRGILLTGSGACAAGLAAGTLTGQHAACSTDLIAVELVGFLAYTLGSHAFETCLRQRESACGRTASTTCRLDLHAACEHLANLHFLTPRERQVFPLIAAGHSAAYTAERLGVKATTVRTHIRNIHRKLHVQTFDELIALVQDTMEATSAADILRGRQNPIPTQGRAKTPTR